MILRVVSLLLLLFSLSSFGTELSEEDFKKIINEESNSKQIRDIDTGLVKDGHRISQDKNRLSFLYHVNSNLYNLTKVNGLELEYAYHLGGSWLELFYKKVNADFGSITDNNPNDGIESESLENSSDSVDIFGAGLSIRGKWIQELVGSNSIYTQSGGNLAYYSLAENFRGQTYTGPGVKTDFGLHVRGSKSMHYGVKLAYHLAHVRRPKAFDSETSKDRSLLLSWLTIGIDLSFYF